LSTAPVVVPPTTFVTVTQPSACVWPALAVLQQLKELTTQATDFATKQLPILKALQIM
jgi:hypothetical protein